MDIIALIFVSIFISFFANKGVYNILAGEQQNFDDK
jgi:hypothetical protein